MLGGNVRLPPDSGQLPRFHRARRGHGASGSSRNVRCCLLCFQGRHALLNPIPNFVSATSFHKMPGARPRVSPKYHNRKQPACQRRPAQGLAKPGEHLYGSRDFTRNTRPTLRRLIRTATKPFAHARRKSTSATAELLAVTSRIGSRPKQKSCVKRNAIHAEPQSWSESVASATWANTRSRRRRLRSRRIRRWRRR